MDSETMSSVATEWCEYWELEGEGECHCTWISGASPLKITKWDGQQKDIIHVWMFTTEVPADSTSVAEFRKVTVEDTTPVVGQSQESILIHFY